MVHYGHAAEVLDNRQRVLTAAFQQHPERFVRKPPRRRKLWVRIRLFVLRADEAEHAG
jgi:hypothetical protein